MKKPCSDKTPDGKETIKCPICNDAGYIYHRDTNSAQSCQCLEVKRQRQLQEKSGISEAFKQKKLENYDGQKNQVCKAMKRLANRYIADFSNKNLLSIGFFGQSGAGKTHLTIAIANRLLDMSVPVYYMPYVEKITELKNLNRAQNSRYYDDEDLCYDKVVRELKTVKVLLIDDLFKRSEDNYGRVNTVDVRIMFEIINERYIRGLPIIVSSELAPAEIIKIDEALGSRIIEMCAEYYYAVQRNTGLNYRLRDCGL